VSARISPAERLIDGDEEARAIVIPYTPRNHFIPFHNSKKRFRAAVVHRRGGKTVAIGNDHIKNALQNERAWPPPRYGYVGPSFSQAKDTIWAYLKQYTNPIPGVKVSESDLQITLPNSAVIALYPGADAYERMRGLYFDGIAMDEFALLNPDAWPSVVRPCLADYRGYAVIAGTSNGDDHFHEMIQKGYADPDNWDVFNIRVSDTDALHPDEVIEMRKDMGERRFNREMMNSFDEPVDGAYFAEIINKLVERNQITKVPYDPRSPVITFWDLGIRDLMTCWFMQQVGREIRVIDYHQGNGKGLDWHYLVSRGREGDAAHRLEYNIEADVFPHDIEVREMGSGRTRREVAESLGFEVMLSPLHKVEDGIEGVRTFLPGCWIDEQRCALGIAALKSYKQGRNGKPLHDWASHGADSMRAAAMTADNMFGWVSSNAMIKIGRALRRKIRGVR
jgi:hypothetical protein